MIKSFQTSGGTVLSTNWNEVKEKDYEGKDLPNTPMDSLKEKLSPMTNNRADMKESICRVMSLLGEEPPTHRPWL